VKACIIEPHYDDAWLSMGNYILAHPEIDFTIISVSCSKYNDKNETELLPKYAKNIKITYSLRAPDLVWKDRILPDPKTVDERQESVGTYMNVSAVNIFTIRKNLCTIFSDNDYDMTFIPLGIQHPMHVVLGAILGGTHTYLDSPYAYKKKFLPLVKELTIGSEDVWEHGIDNNERKTEIFKKVYKSQSFFFKGDCLSRPERIIKFKPIDL